MSRTVVVTPAELGRSEVVVRNDLYRHLFRSARHRTGDRLRLVDGAGRARWGEVLEVGPREARLGLGEPAANGEAARRIGIWVPMPKAPRATWLVEKATELGVVRIVFFRSTRAPRSPGASRLDRLARVAVAAVEQSGRSLVPELVAARDLADLLADALPMGALFHLDPRCEEGFPSDLGNEVTAVVGPEGGWGDDELDLLCSAGSRPVRLGLTTLRTETAAIAALACLTAAAPGRPTR